MAEIVTMRLLCLGMMLVMMPTLATAAYGGHELRGKYIVISPRVFRTGSTEILSCTLFGMTTDESVTYRVTKGKRLIVSGTVLMLATASDRNVEIAIEVPKNAPTGSAELHLKAIRFNETRTVQLQRLDVSVFIQTDKPIYKPGEKVQFRVVTVKPNLLPETSHVSEIAIMNPSGSRMMQWKEVPSKQGIVSKHFKLTDRPLLGTWTIKATLKTPDGSEVRKSQTVVVEKYVLPKYEVTVKSPPYLVEGEPKFMVSVCAKYTYGKPVVGKLSLNVCIRVDRKYRWIRQPDYPCHSFVMDIDGCVDQEVVEKALTKRLLYRHYCSLHVSANVTETATGVTLRKATNGAKIEYNGVRLSFDGSANSFKPGFPYLMKFSVKGVDGRPIMNKFVIITIKKNGRLLKTIETVVSTGFMEMEIDVPTGSSSLHMQAVYQNKKGAIPNRNSHSSRYVTSWYSPSSSYLMITKPMRSFKVREQLSIRVLARSQNPAVYGNSFYYNLLCRGNTVLSGTKHASVYGKKIEFDIKFRVTQKMVPMCRLLVYFVRADGEFVGDNADIQLETNFVNKVTVAFTDASRKPGQKVGLVLQASPGSLMAISAVDRSVQLLGKTNDITADEVINVLKSQDVKDRYYSEYRPRCNYDLPWFWRRRFGGRREFRKRRSILPYFHGDSKYDGKEALKNAGVVYITNLDVDVVPCRRLYYPEMAPAGPGMEMSAAGPDMAMPIRPVMMRKNSAMNGRPPPPAPTAKSTPKAPPAPVKVRSSFPETWLWIEEQLDAQYGKKTITVKVPDTMTTWYANAFAISGQDGIGVSSPTSIRVMQPFFVSLSLPYSIIRGEKATILATVFNYLAGSLTIEIALEGSADFESWTLSPTTKLCIGGNKAGTVKFSVKPKVLGRIAIKVTAVTLAENLCEPSAVLANEFGAADAVLRKLLVEPEGIKKELTYSTFFCPQHVNASLDHPYKEIVPLQLPAKTVPGSVHASISVVGDLMGPTLSGLDGLLKMPYGCGEQNMLNFAPNIYVMKYLQATSQVTSDIKRKAKEFMIAGYQRELTYRRKDGSYAAFGERDRDGGSTWLTAFVLKSYAQAQGLIYIDGKDIDVSVRWLLKIQQKDGCFPTVGMVHHSSMKGGVTSGITMTAFVLNALLEAGLSTTNANVVSAVSCIESGLSTINDSYDAAIIAYTLTLAKSPKKQMVMDYLTSKAIHSDGMTHWEGEEKKPQKDHSWWYYQAPSADVEMTAYALMAYTSEDLSKTVPIIKWLSKQRNSYGGFSSTQDTCVALQGLSEYASLVYTGGMDLTVNVKAVNLAHTFSVNDGNKLVQQRLKVPTVPCNVTVEATGKGCALLQSSVQYNIPNPVDEPSFSVDVTTSGVRGTLCQHNLKVCSKYTGEGKTNMAIIAIKMVSGFIAITDKLDTILQSTGSSHLRDYEIKDGTVFLYFSEIDDVCVDLIVDQENEVEDRKPATVTVYDYYATGNSAVAMYKLTKCNQDLN